MRRVRGSQATLHLAPGLHQISIAAPGLRAGLGTVVTVPAS